MDIGILVWWNGNCYRKMLEIDLKNNKRNGENYLQLGRYSCCEIETLAKVHLSLKCAVC